MLIGLSGTPGVGKTTVSELLGKMGHSIIDLNKLALEQNFIEGYDERRKSKIIDIEELDEFITKQFVKGDFIIEGHLAHLCSVDFVVILRCDPLVLKDRLKVKNWPVEKIRENIQAEVLDVIKVEAYENLDNVFEIDTTNEPPHKVAQEIVDIIKGIYKKPNISWLEKYEYLLFE